MPVKVGLKHIEIWNSNLEKEICRYEEEPVVKGQIVFYGPSNFTRWAAKWGMTPLREAVVGASGAPCCINRGFGSSCPEHQLYYYHRMIKPLEPKVLVYSSFGNSRSFGYTPEETFELAQRVVAYTQTDFPDCRVYLLATTKHKRTWDGYDEEAAKYDAMLADFAAKTPNCFLLDDKTYAPLVTDMDKIFVEDEVHYNQEGYHRYADFFREALKEELDQF